MSNPTNREDAIVEAALAMPPEQRGDYLDQACGEDVKLRRLVEALLRAHQQAQVARDPPTVPISEKTMFVTVAPTEKPGDRIGHYKLLQEIGEGGCGVVYMAEQTEPVRRRVALKVIKLGMDTKQVIARFEAERQALALMDHPNIAKVLDAGATDTGRPYFVMELVKGVRITDYCDQSNLSTEERLKLFTQVCQAIQHAHQKGIIHRDIKPSNIMVTLQDGVPVPKVIDFGIAKATDQSLTDKTVFTAFGQFIGTPAYMSPEQAELSGLDIDTRSDIYALGVLLYELLTGKTPFDAETLLHAGMDEMRRIIREDEPPRPSTRLSTLSVSDATALAKHRKEKIPALVDVMRGDLDWIVMKCLEKDRTRRYETANGLATDIQRHLTNEPVVARPPSNLYRFQKLVRRNKLAFGGAAAITTVLILGIIVSTWQAVRATRAKGEKTAALGKEQQAKQEESRQRQRAEELLDRLEIDRAEQLFGARDSPSALAYLANVLRRNPSNRIAAERLLSALTYRSFPIPAIEPVRHGAQIECAQFSPDSSQFVTASADKTARIWEASTGRALTQPLPSDGPVLCTRFSPDGEVLVTGSEDKQARIWNAHSGQLVFGPLKHQGAVNYAEFSSDNERLLTTSTNICQIWNARTGQPLGEPMRHQKAILSAHFSPDGRKLLTASEDETAQIWDALSGRHLAGPLKHKLRVVGAEFSPDGRKVLTASYDNTAKIWDADTGQLFSETSEHGWVVPSAHFRPDGNSVVTMSWDDTVRLWEVKAGKLKSETEVKFDTPSIAKFSPDGLDLLISNLGNWLRICDLRGDPAAEPVRFPQTINSADFSSDSQRIMVVHKNEASIFDIRFGQALAAWSTSGPRFAPTDAILPDEAIGETNVSSDGLRKIEVNGSSVTILSTRTGKPLTEPLRHADMINSAAFSPDAKLVLTASDDRTARVWDAFTGQPLTEPLKHGRRVQSAKFSPDGKRVATLTGKGTIMIWHALTGQPLSEPLLVKDPMMSLPDAFSHTFFVHFNLQGNSVSCIGSSDTNVWVLPNVSDPAPLWLAEMAEAIGGWRLSSQRTMEAVDNWEVFRLRKLINGSPSRDEYTSWARWFFADRSSRPISYSSPVTVPDYVQRRLEEDSIESIYEAVLLSRTNGLAFARLSRRILKQESLEEHPLRTGQVHLADLCSRRAMELSPNDPEVLRIRMEVSERIEKQVEAEKKQ